VVILIQFICRLSFGLALSMGLTSSRKVPSGFFRVHLYVLMGLNALAVLACWQRYHGLQLAIPIVASIASYVGAALWLYELPRPGKIALWTVTLLSIGGAWMSLSRTVWGNSLADVLWILDPVTGGLLLGSTMAAMLLGHWYLNTPSMQLEPLRKLILLMGVAVILRGLVCGIGLGLTVNSTAGIGGDQVWFLLLRWLGGILGTLGVAIMAWETLKIPNTQSATGILYVGVITTFIGELTSQLLSDQALFPL
jgi:hypothetical protein